MEQLNSWYLNINPNGVVPTLIYQGKPIVESRDISLFAVKEISDEGRLLLKHTKVGMILIFLRARKRQFALLEIAFFAYD